MVYKWVERKMVRTVHRPCSGSSIIINHIFVQRFTISSATTTRARTNTHTHTHVRREKKETLMIWVCWNSRKKQIFEFNIFSRRLIVHWHGETAAKNVRHSYHSMQRFNVTYTCWLQVSDRSQTQNERQKYFHLISMRTKGSNERIFWNWFFPCERERKRARNRHAGLTPTMGWVLLREQNEQRTTTEQCCCWIYSKSFPFFISSNEHTHNASFVKISYFIGEWSKCSVLQPAAQPNAIYEIALSWCHGWDIVSVMLNEELRMAGRETVWI